MFRIVKLSKDEWALSFRKGKIVKVLSFTKGVRWSSLKQIGLKEHRRGQKVSAREAEKIIVTQKYFFKKLAVDFDRTLFSTAEEFPNVGKPKLIHRIVAAYVRRKSEQGWVIILNTMREKGKGLEKAIEACEKWNIPIDYYNENPQADIDHWGDSRKIGATRSIDDTQVGLIGWLLRTFG